MQNTIGHRDWSRRSPASSRVIRDFYVCGELLAKRRGPARRPCSVLHALAPACVGQRGLGAFRDSWHGNYRNLETPNPGDARERKTAPTEKHETHPHGFDDCRLFWQTLRNAGIHPNSQFFHHRPYRPWKKHAGRPPDGGHRNRQRTGYEGSAPRFHGYRAGAGHHHQGQYGSHRIQGGRWQSVRAQSDRHAGTRGFRIRGLAIHAGGRRIAARRRRIARRRSANASQRVSGSRGGP